MEVTKWLKPSISVSRIGDCYSACNIDPRQICKPIDSQKAIKHALDANHANTSGVVSIYAGAQLSVLLGEMDDAKSYVQNLNAQLGSRVPQWAISCGLIMSGWAIGYAELPEDGLALIKQGIHAAEGQVRFHSTHYYCLPSCTPAREICKIA